MTPDEMVAVGHVHLDTDPGRGNMVVLREDADSTHHFIMFVGGAEFAAIAKEKGLLDPKRPLTHQMYLAVLDRLPAVFDRVEIYDLREDTFYAKVIFRVQEAEHAVDSRPSDAVALALNRKIPIFVARRFFRRRLTQQQIEQYETLVKKVKF